MDILEKIDGYLINESDETLINKAVSVFNKESYVSFCDWDNDDEEVLVSISKEGKGLNFRVTRDGGGSRVFRDLRQAIKWTIDDMNKHGMDPKVIEP